MKRFLRISILFLLCGVLVVLGGALALALYYHNNFPVNTWINGVYCTGKSIEQVNEELVAQTVIPQLVIEEADGTKWELDLQEADISADYSAALRFYLYQNATYQWTQNLDTPVSAILNEVDYSWNREKLSEMYNELDFVKQADSRREGVEVSLTDEGYSLYDGNTERLHTQKALKYIESYLAKGMMYVNLAEGDCYETLEDSVKDKSQRVLWQQLSEVFGTNLVYDMGAEKIPLTPAILSSFLVVEGENVSLNEEAVKGWVTELAADYDTVKTTRDFQSTRGDIVQVKYVTYGTQLDQKAEAQWLLENIWENKVQRAEPEYHIPTYIKEGFVRGLDDIGDTYIEVDLGEQHMYYYLDGELYLETDIVSGCPATGNRTPEGINFVYNKQTDRILRGPGYASPVDYWMPVKGSIGIHDADWRETFGGEIYKRNGSHGCINTPKELMPDLYENTEIGTPVVMFY